MLGTTLLTIVAATSIGQAVWWLCGARSWSWAAPATGLATMLLLAPAAFTLTNGLTLAAIVLGVATVASIVLLLRRREMLPPWWLVPALLPSLALALLPFVANARFGILGVSFNNDMAAHLLFTAALQDGANWVLPPYYPVGSHSIVGAISTPTGWSIEAVFTGFTIAIPSLIAVGAMAFLHDLSWWRRTIVATATAMPFLLASYFAQAGFKELIMIALLLGMAAALRQGYPLTSRGRFVPVGLLIVGTVANYATVGAAWPLLALGLIVVVWALDRARAGVLVPSLRENLPPVIVSVVVAALALLPQLSWVTSFAERGPSGGIAREDLGNLAGPIDPAAALGVWLQPDFRFAPFNAAPTELWGLVVLVAAVLGLLWWIRQRDVLVPIVGLVCLAIWWVSDQSQSPYSVAKALALVSPFVLLVVGRFLLAPHRGLPRPMRLVPLGVGLAVMGAAGWSSVEALRHAQVGPFGRLEALQKFRPIVQGQPTLFLGINDFASWALWGAHVAQPMFPGPGLELREEKPWVPGQTPDVDSVTSESLDRVAYVVAVRGVGASAMPESFRRVDSSGDFDLYRRVGKVKPRSILREGQDGARVLRCDTRAGKRIAQRTGVAGVRGPTETIPLHGMAPGTRQEQTLRLSRGTWDLAMRYTSSRDLRVQAPGLDRMLPASLDRAGSVWPIGTVKVSRFGRIPVRITADDTRLGPLVANVQPTELIAQRRGGTAVIPLREACGKNVDWYRERSSE